MKVFLVLISFLGFASCASIVARTVARRLSQLRMIRSFSSMISRQSETSSDELASQMIVYKAHEVAKLPEPKGNMVKPVKKINITETWPRTRQSKKTRSALDPEILIPSKASDHLTVHTLDLQLPSVRDHEAYFAEARDNFARESKKKARTSPLYSTDGSTPESSDSEEVADDDDDDQMIIDNSPPEQMIKVALDLELLRVNGKEQPRALFSLPWKCKLVDIEHSKFFKQQFNLNEYVYTELIGPSLVGHVLILPFGQNKPPPSKAEINQSQYVLLGGIAQFLTQQRKHLFFSAFVKKDDGISFYDSNNVSFNENHHIVSLGEESTLPETIRTIEDGELHVLYQYLIYKDVGLLEGPLGIQDLSFMHSFILGASLQEAFTNGDAYDTMTWQSISVIRLIQFLNAILPNHRFEDRSLVNISITLECLRNSEIEWIKHGAQTLPKETRGRIKGLEQLIRVMEELEKNLGELDQHSEWLEQIDEVEGPKIKQMLEEARVFISPVSEDNSLLASLMKQEPRLDSIFFILKDPLNPTTKIKKEDCDHLSNKLMLVQQDSDELYPPHRLSIPCEGSNYGAYFALRMSIDSSGDLTTYSIIKDSKTSKERLKVTRTSELGFTKTSSFPLSTPGEPEPLLVTATGRIFIYQHVPSRRLRSDQIYIQKLKLQKTIGSLN